jgi:hypothetical protein
MESKGVLMKKLVSIGVVVVLLVAAVSLVAGCGGSGDTAKAKQYMQAGDVLMKQVETEGTQLSNTIQTAFSSVTDPASFSAAVQKSKAATAKVTSTAEKAKAEYEKINSLSGVSDYKKYADLQISAMNTIVELSSEVNKFLDQAVSIVNSGGSTEQLTAAQNAFTTQITSLSTKITKDQAAAAKLKTDKKL